MPGPFGISGTATPVSTEVRAYVPLHSGDVEADTSDPEAYGRYHLLIDLAESASTLSDEDGCYQLALDAEEFSIVADDDGAWYCNLFDGMGRLCAIEVAPDEVTHFDVIIDYRAAY